MEIQRTIPVEGGTLRVEILSEEEGGSLVIKGEGLVDSGFLPERFLDERLGEGWRGEYEMEVRSRRVLQLRLGIPPLRIRQQVQFCVRRPI